MYLRGRERTVSSCWKKAAFFFSQCSAHCLMKIPLEHEILILFFFLLQSLQNIRNMLFPCITWDEIRHECEQAVSQTRISFRCCWMMIPSSSIHYEPNCLISCTNQHVEKKHFAVLASVIVCLTPVRFPARKGHLSLATAYGSS